MAQRRCRDVMAVCVSVLIRYSSTWGKIRAKSVIHFFSYSLYLEARILFCTKLSTL